MKKSASHDTRNLIQRSRSELLYTAINPKAQHGKIWLRELFAPKLLNSNSIPVCVFGNVHPLSPDMLCATSVGLICKQPRRAMQRSSLSNGMEKCWRANGFEKCWRASGNDRRCICPTLDDQCICVSLCRTCRWCYARGKAAQTHGTWGINSALTNSQTIKLANQQASKLTN